jgi:hypothetical protein
MKEGRKVKEGRKMKEGRKIKEGRKEVRLGKERRKGGKMERWKDGKMERRKEGKKERRKEGKTERRKGRKEGKEGKKEGKKEGMKEERERRLVPSVPRYDDFQGKRIFDARAHACSACLSTALPEGVRRSEIFTVSVKTIYFPYITYEDERSLDKNRLVVRPTNWLENVR